MRSSAEVILVKVFFFLPRANWGQTNQKKNESSDYPAESLKVLEKPAKALFLLKQLKSFVQEWQILIAASWSLEKVKDLHLLGPPLLPGESARKMHFFRLRNALLHSHSLLWP